MDMWTHPMASFSMDEILKAVNDEKWQAFRLSLKGKPTTKKLVMLDVYLVSSADTPRLRQVRVCNYINALKRGGQLSLDLKVQR